GAGVPPAGGRGGAAGGGARGPRRGAWVGGGGGGPRPAVPHGGSRSALGTNPISVGFPVQDEHPVVMDYATTAIAVGKIMVARAAGKHLAPGLLLDRNGQPTTDPEEYYKEGALLPFGGHKGYSLSVLAEVLAQALTGAERFEDPVSAEGVFGRAGAFFLAIHVGAFRPPDEAKGAARKVVTRLRQVPPAPGVESVQTPGEPAARTMRQRAAAGVEIADTTWRSIVATAESLGMPAGDLPSPPK